MKTMMTFSCGMIMLLLAGCSIAPTRVYRIAADRPGYGHRTVVTVPSTGNADPLTHQAAPRNTQAPAQAPSSVPAEDPGQPSLSPAPAYHADTAQGSGDLIGHGDTLTIQVFELFAPDQYARLNVTVDSNGIIDMPLLDTVPAAGLTPHALSNEIIARLKRNFIRNPKVSITLQRAASAPLLARTAAAAVQQ